MHKKLEEQEFEIIALTETKNSLETTNKKVLEIKQNIEEKLNQSNSSVILLEKQGKIIQQEKHDLQENIRKLTYSIEDLNNSLNIKESIIVE